MRNLSLVDCVELKFPGSVLKNSLCIGDCDNDGYNELIVGNATGDLNVFRGDKCVYMASDLGPIGAVAVGDLLSIRRNVLVVITIDGWCHVFDVEADAMQQKKDEADAGPQFLAHDYYLIFPFHSQKIPPNVKTLHLGDVNEDGLVEMVVGLTDRVLRTYQWRSDIGDGNKGALQEERNGKVKEDEDSRSDTSDIYDGRLFGVNKWEFASQIGSVALHEVDNVLSIVVGQPGCNVTTITERSEPCLSENSVETIKDADGKQMSGSTGSFVVRNESPSDSIVIQHHQYHCDSVQNSSISTEVVGNLASINRKSYDRLGIATLDGTLLIAKNDNIEWNLQVDNQILSLYQLNGKLIACSWNGDTYLIDGKETIRFHFEDSVAAFYAGSYAFPDDLLSDEHNLVNKYSFIYVTFDERIYVYPIDLV